MMENKRDFFVFDENFVWLGFWPFIYHNVILCLLCLLGSEHDFILFLQNMKSRDSKRRPFYNFKAICYYIYGFARIIFSVNACASTCVMCMQSHNPQSSVKQCGNKTKNVITFHDKSIFT